MTPAQTADIDAATDGAIARHRGDIICKLVLAGTGPDYVAHPSRDCFALLDGDRVEVIPRALAPLMFAPIARGGCVVACLADPPPDGLVWIVVLFADGITHVVRELAELLPEATDA